MKVYVISQAYEGEIRGVYMDKDEADAECARINASDRAPAAVEEHDVVATKEIRDHESFFAEVNRFYEALFLAKD